MFKYSPYNKLRKLVEAYAAAAAEHALAENGQRSVAAKPEIQLRLLSSRRELLAHIVAMENEKTKTKTRRKSSAMARSNGQKTKTVSR